MVHNRFCIGTHLRCRDQRSGCRCRNREPYPSIPGFDYDHDNDNDWRVCYAHRRLLAKRPLRQEKLPRMALVKGKVGLAAVGRFRDLHQACLVGPVAADMAVHVAGV